MDTAEQLTASAASAVMSVLAHEDVPPLRALHHPGYLREFSSEVVRGPGDEHYIALTVPKRGYGTYKRRGPKNRAIPPECDTKQLEAVFAMLLPAPFKCIAVRNALTHVIVYLSSKEVEHDTSTFDAGSKPLL